MKKFFGFISAVSLLIFSPSIFALDDTSKTTGNALGVSGGWVVGNGILYRHYFPSSFVQGTFAGLVNRDSGTEYLDVSLSGGPYLRTVENQFIGLPMGLKWINGIELVHDQEYFYPRQSIHVGTGIGVDFGAVKSSGIGIGLDLIYVVSFNSFSKPTFRSLDFRPAFNTFYRF